MTSHLGREYGDWANDEIFLAVQIESIQAVEQAKAILPVKGVDGCWIGPKDLARSMGVDVNTPAGRQAHVAAVLQVLAACRQTGKISGIDACSEANARRWLDPGMQFVTVTSDTNLLASGGPALMQTLLPPS